MQNRLLTGPWQALLLLFLISATTCACSVASPRPPQTANLESPVSKGSPPAAPCLDNSDESPAERIAQHGTVLDRYRLEGGAWLSHAPVLVNRDFDFALAMAMEGGLGAGLAAAKRKQENEARASELSELRLSEAAMQRLASLRCQGTYVYFVLWESNTTLLTVFDVLDDPKRSRVVETRQEGDLVEALERELGQSKR